MKLLDYLKQHLPEIKIKYPEVVFKVGYWNGTGWHDAVVIETSIPMEYGSQLRLDMKIFQENTLKIYDAAILALAGVDKLSVNKYQIDELVFTLK